ncbi:unnamed protein product, partial [Scytosiphon promiscuus]
APSPQAPTAAVETASGGRKLLSPDPVDADRVPNAVAGDAADASESQGIDPLGDDGISLLLGAMEEVTVEDKEEENGERKAKKEKDDLKEGEEEDQEEKAKKDGAVAAPQAPATRSTATEVKVAGGDNDRGKKEETACATVTTVGATAFSGAGTPGKAVLGGAPPLPSAEAASPAATVNITDGGRGSPISRPSARAQLTFFPCHPAHAGCKASPGKLSGEGKSATGSGDGLLAEGPGSEGPGSGEVSRLGPIVAVTAPVEGQGVDTDGDDGISLLLGAMQEVTVEDK